MTSGPDGERPPSESSFADVMNGFSLNSGRSSRFRGRGRREKEPEPAPQRDQQYYPPEAESDPLEMAPAGALPTEPDDDPWYDQYYRPEAESDPLEMAPAGALPTEPDDDPWYDQYYRPEAESDPLEMTPAEALPTEPDDDPRYDVNGYASATVRPYAWTSGRTKSSYHLELETLVSTSSRGREQLAVLPYEHRSIAELCEETRSVAEVAGLLRVPLGVAKVVLGDMAGLGLVTVQQTQSGNGDGLDLALLERVLSGLRRL